MVVTDSGAGAGTGLDVTAANVSVNSTVTTLNDGPATYTVGTLLDIAAAGDMFLDGAFLQDGAGA